MAEMNEVKSLHQEAHRCQIGWNIGDKIAKRIICHDRTLERLWKDVRRFD